MGDLDKKCNFLYFLNENFLFSISGFICCQDFYHNNSLQFVCVNGQPILQSEALKIINHVVIKSPILQSKENVTKQAIFVLIYENVDLEKIGSILEHCLNQGS